MATLQETIVQAKASGSLMPTEWTLADGTKVEILAAKVVPSGRADKTRGILISSLTGNVRVKTGDGLFAVEGNALVPYTR